MIRRWTLALGALGALVACDSDDARITAPAGAEAFTRYVSIGTSLSAGTQSNGILYTTQARSWPALLADQAFAEFRYPGIQSPGCPPPLIAPLQLGRRLSGTAASAADNSCAPLRAGVLLPTNNVAVPGATTLSALEATPEDFAEGTLSRNLFSRILPSGESQVTAMASLGPTLVSVELGANEVLGAVQSGHVIPNVTITPAATWEPIYTEVVEAVVATGARGMLVTVPLVSRIPSLRTGEELYENRAEFLAFNVVVNADCDNSTNLIFTTGMVLTKVAQGQALAAQGQQAQLSCANQAPGPTPDFVLTAADVATIEAVVTTMNEHIAELAAEHDFALVDANAVLQQFLDERPAFSVRQMMSCVFPHGQYMSLDGVHPNGYGYQLVANAAAEALNEHYGFELPTLNVAQITPLCS